MAAGATRKVKQAEGETPEAAKTKAKKPRTKRPKALVAKNLATKKPAAKTKAKAVKSAPGKTASKTKAAAKQKRGAKTPAKKRAKPKASSATDADTLAMLKEQNEALRTELDRAQERISELEELNRNVVNRIDWVIDSLQGLLTER